MSQPFDLEQTIASAAQSGWDWFDQIPDDAIKSRVKLEMARRTEDKRAIAAAWARFADSPDGRLALEALFDTTLRRTVFFANLGQEPLAMATWGAFREGQNALAQAIALQIAAGRETEEQPKPRDVA